MSVPGSPQPREEKRDEKKSKIDQARSIGRLVMLALVVAAVIWFVVANRQQVVVNWFGVETRSRLFLVIILSGVLGALVDRLLRWRRTKKK